MSNIQENSVNGRFGVFKNINFKKMEILKYVQNTSAKHISNKSENPHLLERLT